MSTHLIREAARLVTHLSSLSRRCLRAADASSGRYRQGVNFKSASILLATGLVWLLMALPMTSAESTTQASDAKQNSSEAMSGWKKYWAVEEGFSLSIDTEGYD